MKDEIASPCINVCNLDPATGLCTGCRRTLEEIANWGSYTSDQKRAVIRALETRTTPFSPSGSLS